MNKYIRWLIAIMATLTLSTCHPDVPAEGTSPNWEVDWSNTTGNSLPGVDGTNGWKTSYERLHGYLLATVARDAKTMPTDVTLDFSTDNSRRTSIQQFLSEFLTKNGYDPTKVNQSNLNFTSCLFGVDPPTGLASSTYGSTSVQGWLSVNYSLAVSFIFVSQISFDFGNNAAAVTGFVTVHELGHARGLNSYAPDEHTWHGGDNQTICVMRVPTSGSITTPYYFCDRHKKVLEQCLGTKIVSMYTTSDACAQFP